MADCKLNMLPYSTDERALKDLDNDKSCGNQDCNDNDASIAPHLPEICGNNKDEDCDTLDKFCPPEICDNQIDDDDDGKIDCADEENCAGHSSCDT